VQWLDGDAVSGLEALDIVVNLQHFAGALVA
jgi:hypothetical protein